MANRAHTRIESLYDLRYFLSKLINQVQRGQITTEKGKALASISRVLMDVMQREQDKEIMQRLEELEKQSGISSE